MQDWTEENLSCSGLLTLKQGGELLYLSSLHTASAVERELSPGRTVT